MSTPHLRALTMRSTTPCTCTSRMPLCAVTATRLDAYSTGAASVYSCGASQTDVKYARSALSQAHEQGAGRSLIRLVARNRRSRDRPGFRCYSLDQALSVLRRARACTPHGIQNRPRELEQLRSDGDGLLCLLYVHRMGLTPPCTCTSRTPLRAVTATRLDASVYSTSAASVYSCSTSQIHVRLAQSAFSQDRA